MGQFGQFDAPPSSLQLVALGDGLRGPEGMYTLALPSPMERSESRRAELPRAGREVQIRVRRRVGRPALARSKEPVELVNLLRCQRRRERIPDSVAIEGRSLPQSAWDEEADRPFADRPEEVGGTRDRARRHASTPAAG